MTDNSGIEFFYTSIRRQHDAGILTLGHHIDRVMIIPPNAESYSIIGMCSADCTRTVSSKRFFNITKMLNSWLPSHTGLLSMHTLHLLFPHCSFSPQPASTFLPICCTLTLLVSRNYSTQTKLESTLQSYCKRNGFRMEN